MRSEFEFIRNVRDRYGLARVGDDCAVLPKDRTTDLVITADLLVEDVDFRLSWTRPEWLGHKALAVSMSDIAAMGASPKWAMLSIGVPQPLWKGKFLDKFYAGWFGLADQFGVELIGGDVSRSPDRLVIDSIVAGETAKDTAVQRRGARPGELIFVTGSLGGAAAGLNLLDSGRRYSATRGERRRLMERQVRPNPRVEIARSLSRRRIATSMIDISDGLSSDIHHLCAASGVGARIDFDLIPIDPTPAFFSKRDLRDFALHGGEDFELLFTSKQKNISAGKTVAITRIGEITSKTGIVELVSNGNVTILPSKGYSHF